MTVSLPSRLPTCHTCRRTLREGEQAWASDWTVIGFDGTRTEIRYACDGCKGN